MNLAGNDWLRVAWTQVWQVTVLILAVAMLVRVRIAQPPSTGLRLVAGCLSEVHYAAIVEQPQRGVLLVAPAANKAR